jgi:hypothetical protein
VHAISLLDCGTSKKPSIDNDKCSETITRRVARALGTPLIRAATTSRTQVAIAGRNGNRAGAGNISPYKAVYFFDYPETHPSLKHMLLRHKTLLFCMLMIVWGSSGCRPKASRPADYLSSHYMPSAAAPSQVANVDPSESLYERDGAERRQLVTSPSGRAYWLRWRKVSESVGQCSSGSLIDGIRLPRKGVGYRHIGDSSFGTDETVTYLRFAAWAVSEQYPHTAPVVVGDLSDERGGHLTPHRSHQSGRDADVGFYRTENRALRWFKTLPNSELDLAKTWTFIEALLRTGAVEYIFIDRSIQEALHGYATKRGFPDDELKRIFQFPGRNKRTLIRHVAGHKNHLHVRFVCPSEDEDCR